VSTTRSAARRRQAVNAAHKAIFRVQQHWRDFHLEVTKALRAAGANNEYIGTDRIGCCPAIDRAMYDTEYAGCSDEPDLDRAAFLCEVVVRMIERERGKFALDSKAWLLRRAELEIIARKAEVHV
jgi:hypothetical protein